MGDSALLSYLVLGTVVGGLLGVGLHTIQYLNRPAWVRPEHSWHAYFAVGSVAGLTVVLVAPALGWTVPEWDLVVVALLGACVGGGELASRYRDEPTKAIFTRPAMLYIALNAVAAMAAFPLEVRPKRGDRRAVLGG